MRGKQFHNWGSGETYTPRYPDLFDLTWGLDEPDQTLVVHAFRKEDHVGNQDDFKRPRNHPLRKVCFDMARTCGHCGEVVIADCRRFPTHCSRCDHRLWTDW